MPWSDLLLSPFCAANNPARLRSVSVLRPVLRRHRGEWAGVGWWFGGAAIPFAEMPLHYARARVALAPLVGFLCKHPAEITHRIFEAVAVNGSERFADVVTSFLDRPAERALEHVYAHHTVFHRAARLLRWLKTEGVTSPPINRGGVRWWAPQGSCSPAYPRSWRARMFSAEKSADPGGARRIASALGGDVVLGGWCRAGWSNDHQPDPATAGETSQWCSNNIEAPLSGVRYALLFCWVLRIYSMWLRALWSSALSWSARISSSMASRSRMTSAMFGLLNRAQARLESIAV